MRTLLFVAIFPGLLAAQMPPDLMRERMEFAQWVAEAPNSPLAAVAQVPIGTGIRLGPADADVPLPGFGPATITERKGVVTLESTDRTGGSCRVTGSPGSAASRSIPAVSRVERW